MPPPRVSKHGTLNEKDLEDVREVDTDLVLQHLNSASTSHIFGKIGAPPPPEAVVVEPRYTRYWSLQSEDGQDFVGLNKANSAAKGRFEVCTLGEGEYKLVVRLKKKQNVIGYATMPIGYILGGVNSLVSPAEKREEMFARGMPTEYVNVQMWVGTSTKCITEQRFEIDQGNHTVTRVFTVKPADANEGTNLSLVCTSFSLVRRMKVQIDLFRCDFRRDNTTEAWQKMQAAKGRQLVHQALSSNSSKPPPRPPLPGPPRQRTKRVVFIDSSIPAYEVLEAFYSVHAPEKVKEIPRIMEHFLLRDKHLGVLFATLEDKYSVKFNQDGTWQ